MESITICNRINNNTGLKQTDTTGLLCQPLLGDHWVRWRGSISLILNKAASPTMWQRAPSLGKSLLVHLSCPWQAASSTQVKIKQNETKTYSLVEGPEEFWLKKKKIKDLQLKHQHLKKGLRGRGGWRGPNEGDQNVPSASNKIKKSYGYNAQHGKHN